VTAKDDAERRTFFTVGWMAALDRIRDPYVQNPNADPAPGFFIGYRDGANAQTGYLRILSRFRDDGELLRRLPKIPSGAANAD
jgi:hypothetical protein